MADGGITKWTPTRNIVRILASKYQIQPSVENEQAHPSRDGQTLLERQNYHARPGTGEKVSFLVELTTTRIGSQTIPRSILC